MTTSSENVSEAYQTLFGSNVGCHPLIEQVQTQADALFRKWCLSWREGTELEIAIALLETTLHLAEMLPNVESAVLAKLLRQQGNYRQESLFRQGRKVDADEAARCLLKVLQYEPSNFSVMADLSWICLYQNDVTASRRTLDDAIEFIENALAISPADHEKFSAVLRVAAMSLIKRAQFDGCNQVLDMASHLLRAGLSLPHLYQDDHALLRLLLAHVHLLRFESSESFEDLNEAEILIGQTATEFTVNVQHEAYRNELRGRMFQTRWKYLRTRDDLTESFSAYTAMNEAIDGSTASPSCIKNSFRLRCADLLRLSYYQYSSDILLSRAYNFAKEACTVAKIRASGWHVSGISGVEAEGLFIMGEVQRSRHERFGATSLLDDAVSSFRQSAQMTEQKDADFAERASALSAILRKRSKADHTNAYQRQADLYEARHWVGKVILSRLPLRRRDHVDCVLEIGHVLWDSGGPVDRVIALYQHAVDLDTMDFANRVQSWRSLAQALISRGRNTKNTDDLATAGTYLNMVERLEQEKDSRSTGRLPVVADLQSAYYELTVSDSRSSNECMPPYSPHFMSI
jgi:tetratricopeptide (TPR) repeat protein